MAQSQEYDSDETRDDQNEPNVVEETQIEFDGRQQHGRASSDKMEFPNPTKGAYNADYNYKA
jgi:hypothetical protein